MKFMSKDKNMTSGYTSCSNYLTNHVVNCDTYDYKSYHGCSHICHVLV